MVAARPTTTLEDLVHAFEVAPTAAHKAWLRSVILSVTDTDPLTVIDPDATDRNAPVGRQAPDLHDQHPPKRDGRGLLSRIRRWLDDLAVVPGRTAR